MWGYDTEEYDTDRYRTPAGFRRTKDLELEQAKEEEERIQRNKEEEERRQRNRKEEERREREREAREVEESANYVQQTEEPVNNNNIDMSNPYLDRGYTMPYQISQNKYREQVFGTKPEYNYPAERQEPLAGRTLPPRNYRPKSYTEAERQLYQNSPPRNNYESPRQQQYGSPEHTYRSGRPDLGFDYGQKNYVPYPQEPLRRNRQEYENSPDIGFNPHADPEAPKNHVPKDDTMGPHSGWILLMRFHKDGEPQVRRALTMCVKHIEADSGRILGIAKSYSVRIREGGDSWVTFGRMRHFGGGNWDVQQSPIQDETNYCVLAIYYPSLSRAIQWFDRDCCFKQKDFPAPHTIDCIALPLNSSVDTKYNKTIVMSEYARISHPEYFRDKFSVPTEDMMRTRFRASPYVVKASSIPVEDPRQRVARHLRGCWIKRNSIITVSMFDSLQEAHRFFTDPEYSKCKEAQDRVSAPTTVIMDLDDWKL